MFLINQFVRDISKYNFITGSLEFTALFNDKQNFLSNAEFDQEKTTRIKEAIEQGNYPLDHKRLAESFLALEQLISDNA